jgi:hypothetical protein
LELGARSLCQLSENSLGSEFLTEVFRGSPAKREADEQFFRAMHPPPTKEGNE